MLSLFLTLKHLLTQLFVCLLQLYHVTLQFLHLKLQFLLSCHLVTLLLWCQLLLLWFYPCSLLLCVQWFLLTRKCELFLFLFLLSSYIFLLLSILLFLRNIVNTRSLIFLYILSILSEVFIWLTPYPFDIDSFCPNWLLPKELAKCLSFNKSFSYLNNFYNLCSNEFL